MKIKKLQIYGFKTFPQPTEIVFHDGVTSVVGPNGCGKSNIIDALRWVMGEKSAKGLRGDSMSDVIFNGCASRKALNFAEVTLTLAEVEGKLPEKFGNYHEIAVTRRLHRTGESEYLINKVQCRLKDITELFLDTGLGKRAYSVVEQGRIDAILSSKPIDRRFLIEEAAGLSKYRARRDETMNKMKHTGENLERLNDIIVEVRREMNSLKRQAGRARAFKELRDEKRGIERNLMLTAHMELKAKLDDTGKIHADVRAQLQAARAGADRLGAELEKNRLELLEEEKTIEATQRKVYGLRTQISDRENRSTFLERETESLAQRAAKAEEEAGELEARAEDVALEYEELKAALEELTAVLEERAESSGEMEAAHHEALEERRSAEAALEEHRKAVFDTMSGLSRVNNAIEHSIRLEKEAQRRLESLDRQEEDVSSKLAEVERETKTRRDDLATAEKAQKIATEERAELEEDVEDLEFERQNLTRRVEELRREVHADESRLSALTALKDGMELYDGAVSSVLKHARDEKWVGVRGVVADAINVPRRYETALEAALGECLQYVVVADADQAADGVGFLKSNGAGRTTFVPADMKEQPEVKMPSATEQWAHGPLLDLVRIEPGSERVARGLLGQFYVVETLPQALELWRRNGTTATFVTLEGDTLTPAGVLSGGDEKNHDHGLLKRNRELAELSDKVALDTARLSDMEAELEEVKSRHDEVRSRLEFLKEEAHRRELKVAHVSRDMAQFEERRELLEERRDALQFERDDLEGQTLSLREKLDELEAEREELVATSEEAEAGRLALEESLRAAQVKAEALHSDLNRLRVEVASDTQRSEGLRQQLRSLEQGRANTLERAKRLRQEGAQLEVEARDRTEEMRRIATELDVLRRELARMDVSSDELLQGLDEKRAAVAEKDKAAAVARRNAEETYRKVTDSEMAVRETELELRNIGERFAERLDADINEALEAGVDEGFDFESARDRMAVLEQKIRSFGEVNLLAVEEYEERKVRFDFLEEQRVDLEESLNSLKRAINKINRISRERFDETFNAVNEKFKAVFPVLFRGGEAELFLTDPEDLLATGIDIIARPPGKRPQHMSLLSGGEKALTAVSLIFSLFLVKPSPFCVLDEVDAPLDDANVERFTEMLKEMSSTSQFLVITHNKITMEAAEHLYGVTMEEPGISNLVSVRLKDNLHEAEVA